MRGISREVLARDAAWSLPDGACKEKALSWAAWEAALENATSVEAQVGAVDAATGVCAECSITVECGQLAEISRYTGIAAGRAYRNGRIDTWRHRRRS